jgi:uncharacterized protein involved in propanediol utilization
VLSARGRPAEDIHGGVTGVGSAFGTFGELLQGAVAEGDGDFLVTLPIARWARATFRGRPGATMLSVRPENRTKSLAMARMIIEEAGVETGGELTVESQLPDGKGLASSSADLVATARAVGNALRVAMPPERMENHLRRIEPTDGVLYDSIVAYHHRRVTLRNVLGSLPAMTVVGVDEGGAVDTVAFNRIPKPFTAADRREYERLLDQITAAVRSGDLRGVGRVATRSAEMNQVLQPKRTLGAMQAICREVGGLGVVVGHSGTSVGVLLDAGDPAHPDRLAAAANAGYAVAGNVAVYRTLSFHAGRPPAAVRAEQRGGVHAQ